MQSVDSDLTTSSRRVFLRKSLGGLGLWALGNLGPSVWATADPGRPHFRPRARRVVIMHMLGAPPQQDLFDYKPALKTWDGKLCPPEFIEKERFAFIKGHPKLLASPYAFAQHGQSGAWVSSLLPDFASIVDDVTIVRSMFTDEFNHAPAELFLYSGSPRFGRPSMGSWVSCGLGSMNHDLPAFVVLSSGGRNPSAGVNLWGSGFLPSKHQGVACRDEGAPILYLENPEGISRDVRRSQLDLLGELNQHHAARHKDPETAARIAQYELAFRMQISAPEALDLTSETPENLAFYGADAGRPSFAANCLLARRLLERGVRFVQLFDHGWDVHGTNPGDDIITQLPKKCAEVDRGAAALVKDLKRRGLLEDTLVVFTGEFGRTSMNEERNGSKFLGRDHHPHCFTLWMAGAGTKRGAVVGETDELGCRIVHQPIHVHDLQATILHLLGIDHERLTWRFQGRDFRLTDVHGRVARELLA